MRERAKLEEGTYALCCSLLHAVLAANLWCSNVDCQRQGNGVLAISAGLAALVICHHEM